MRLPNGYGSITKLSGKRRKPYAVKVTKEWTDDGKQVQKYLGYYESRAKAIKALADYNEHPYDIDATAATFAPSMRNGASSHTRITANPFRIPTLPPISAFHACTICRSSTSAPATYKASLTPASLDTARRR